MMSTTRRGGGG